MTKHDEIISELEGMMLDIMKKGSGEELPLLPELLKQYNELTRV